MCKVYAMSVGSHYIEVHARVEPPGHRDHFIRLFRDRGYDEPIVQRLARDALHSIELNRDRGAFVRRSTVDEALAQIIGLAPRVRLARKQTLDATGHKFKFGSSLFLNCTTTWPDGRYEEDPITLSVDEADAWVCGFAAAVDAEVDAGYEIGWEKGLKEPVVAATGDIVAVLRRMPGWLSEVAPSRPEANTPDRVDAGYVPSTGVGMKGRMPC